MVLQSAEAQCSLPGAELPCSPLSFRATILISGYPVFAVAGEGQENPDFFFQLCKDHFMPHLHPSLS